ncbi:MAG: FmdB family zinc ribbon protein [Candidatus Aminicenantales bacterium]
MPLYEYRCTACGAVFELVQSVHEAPLTACNRCGGPVHKILSPPALQFKGNGWYVTDYAAKNTPQPEGEKEDKPSKKEDSPSGEKTSSPSPSSEKK